MPSFSRSDVVLLSYPFTDRSGSKVRPAIVVNAPHSSSDLIIIPLTSKTASLTAGEFVLSDWAIAGLNVPSAVKRGFFTVSGKLFVKRLGALNAIDSAEVDRAVRFWLGL
jgi:mRNA interferase MazF